MRPSLRLASFVLFAGCAAAPAHRVDRPRIEREVARLLAAHGEPVQAALWIGDGQDVLWSRDADLAMPAASAIKSALLLELFAEHHADLDAAPADFATLTGDASHPAFAHFAAPLRAEITRELAHASVRRVGRAMIRGDGVSNGVYNAAANLAIAHLGGPAAVTAGIHARDPSFADLHVRRYMLAAREPGDNEASAAGLAAVLQRIASGDLTGVDAATLDAIREVMRGTEHPRFGVHWHKSGALDSAPITRVESGVFPCEGRPLIYVVMLRQDGPGASTRAVAGERLARTALALRDALLVAVEP